MTTLLRSLIVSCFLFHAVICSADYRNFIGAWEGVIDDPFGGATQAEIAIWLTDDSDIDSYEHEKNWLLGFIYVPEKNCATLIEANPTQYNRFRPAKVTKEISERERNFFLGKAIKLRVFKDSNGNNGYKCLGMPVGVGIDFLEQENSESIKIYYKDPYSIRPKSTSFTRTAVSKPLLDHIARINSFSVGAALDGLKQGPDVNQLRILKSSLPTGSQIKSVSVGCASLWRPYALTLAEMGIYGLSGKQEDDQTILSIGWFDESKNDYERLRWTTHVVPHDESFNWNYLKYGPEATMLSDGHCMLDDIFKDLVVYLEKHDLALNALDIADDLVPLDRVVDAYLVDSSGVDLVTSSSDAAFLNLASRNYGTQNIFMPGDFTWRVSFSQSGQRISLYASVKSSKNGDVKKDIMGTPLARNVQYDEALSKKYGADIWVLGKFLRESENCFYWLGRYHSKSCRRDGVNYHSVNDQPPHYITKNREVAIALFKQIAPTASFVDSSTLPSQGTQGCSDAPFCDLPFGGYLNAIYEGDFHRLLQLDNVYISNQLKKGNESVKNTMCQLFAMACSVDFTESMDKFSQFLSSFSQDFQHSFIYPFTSDYIYYYKDNPANCFKENSIKMNINGYIHGQRQENMLGDVVFETPDIDVVSHFHFNREFLPIFKREASARGPVFEVFNSQSLPVKGIKTLQKQYGCRSPEVKRFERNLIVLYWKFKNRPKPYWIRNSY